MPTGDPQVQELLPAVVSADRVALVGLHAWANDDIANVGDWGIRSFSPDDLRRSTQPVLDWIGAEPGGLTTAQARRSGFEPCTSSRDAARKSEATLSVESAALCT